MKLIKEAKRLQQLAGVTSKSISEASLQSIIPGVDLGDMTNEWFEELFGALAGEPPTKLQPQ